MRRATTLLRCVALLGAISLPATALADIEYRDNSAINSAFELKLGTYSPDIDSEFTGNGPYDELFGNRTPIHVEGEYSYQFWRGVGSLGASVALGWSQVKGRALTDDGETSNDFTRLRLMPMRIGLVYRFDYLQERWNVPLSIALKAGVDYYAWFVRNEGGIADHEPATGGGRTIGRGGTTGYHVGAGIYLLLDFLAPRMAAEFDNNAGVNNTYLFAELLMAKVDDFGGANSWDLSDTTALFGLAFEFYRTRSVHRVRLVVAYLGGAYHGWQIQSNVPSVEGVLTDALERMTGERSKIWGASRTDAGVHARGQVAAFDHDGRYTARAFHRALNHMTPSDVSVLSADDVPPDFHPRHSSRGKVYEYVIETGYHRSPFLVGRAMHERHHLDEQAMSAAAQILVGEHDFSSFRAAGCDASSPVRRIWEVRVTRWEHGVKIRVAGTAFLKYMVRSIVGTLVAVGRGTYTPESMSEILAARDRGAAGVTAPACGLTLERVFYPGFPVASP